MAQLLRLKKPFFLMILKEKLKILSIREGEEFGTHRIELKASGEILVLEHQALSRNVFC